MGTARLAYADRCSRGPGTGRARDGEEGWAQGWWTQPQGPCLDTSLTATVSALVELKAEKIGGKKKEREKVKEGRKENRRK